MAKIVVQKATPKSLPSGKTKYECIGTIDGEFDKFDMWSMPEVGKEFEANVKEDPKWGKTVMTGFGGGASRPGGKNDEVTRNEIIRQNALTNAVQYSIAKANLTFQSDPDKAKEALDILSGKHVVQVATYFAKFSKGEVTVVNPSGRPQNEPQSTMGALHDEVSMDDINAALAGSNDEKAPF